MAKKHYQINPRTLAIEEVKTTFRDVLKRLSWSLLVSLILGAGFFFLFVIFFPSPRERQLTQKLNEVRAQNTILSEEVDRMEVLLSDLQMRDDNLYRAMLQADPLPLEARVGNLRPQEYYDSIARLSDHRLAGDLVRKMDVLKNQVYAQNKSYDELVEFAKQREVRLENIPAIMPILNKDLTRFASGFGWRRDPVYGGRAFHRGCDFTAPTGTDIYATGNGRVIFAGWKQGYGNCIIIDHGFNYCSLYAHMSKIISREGQAVHRGEVIGLVGSTGKSTGPHLHYEVHFKNEPVDPKNFYFLDLSPEDYDRMVLMLNNAGNMMD